MEGPSIVNDYVRIELPLDLRPQEEEIRAFTQTLFQDGVLVLLEKFEASKVASEQRNNGASHGFSSPASGAQRTPDSGYSSLPDRSQQAENNRKPPDQDPLIGFDAQLDITTQFSSFDDPMPSDVVDLPILFGPYALDYLEADWPSGGLEAPHSAPEKCSIQHRGRRN